MKSDEISDITLKFILVSRLATPTVALSDGLELDFKDLITNRKDDANYYHFLTPYYNTTANFHINKTGKLEKSADRWRHMRGMPQYAHNNYCALENGDLRVCREQNFKNLRFALFVCCLSSSWYVSAKRL
jgi:hypothetical protein